MIDRRPGVFSLADLDLNRRNEELASLPSVEAQFILPILDEYASGAERLLGSLRGRSYYDSVRSPTWGMGKGKGKGKEKEVEMALVVQHEERGGTPALGDVDLWNAVMDERPAGPSRARTFEPLRSWDVLDKQAASTNTSLLSESGPRLFEAFVTTSEPPLTLPNLKTSAPPAPLDPKELIALMMRATMGTVTTRSLRWEGAAGKFAWDLRGGRPEGIEMGTSESSMQGFLTIATCLRRLENIIESSNNTPLTPTHHALLHSLSTCLGFVKQRLSIAITESQEAQHGWNRWLSALRDVRELLTVLCDLMCWPLEEAKPLPMPFRASSLLSHLYSHLLAHHFTSSRPALCGPIILVLAYLLSRSSGPLLALLHQWVGLANSDAIDNDNEPESQPWTDLGITRKTIRNEPGKWVYEFSAKRLPGFIPKESRRMLFEAGRSLRLLREASGGQHPLCAGGWGLDAKWSWGESSSDHDLKAHSRRVHREIERWKGSSRAKTSLFSASLGALQTSRKERKGLPQEFLSPAKSATATVPVEDAFRPRELKADPLWSMFDQSPGSHLMAKKETPLWLPDPLDELHHFIALHSDPSHPLLPHDSPTLPLYISNHLLAPLLTHSTLVSTALVSLYLDDLRFLDHLDVLHAYWLAGDVDFTERVSGALFGREEAGAGEALGLGRRARTRARLGLGGDDVANGHTGEWGIGLGLGLSERAMWPPGGAELAYALRTTLLDDGRPAESLGPVWEGIDDRVSFAIRPLPEDQADGKRARWLNPQAIEALDFLYLVYSPPPSISVLLPTSLMGKYQSIHNFLLRLARIDVVIRGLARDVLHPSDPYLEPLKTGVDELGRPQDRAISARQGMLSAVPILERLVQRTRFKMTHFVSALSQYVLDTAIGTHWDVMRRRLEKLRRRMPGREESRPSTPTQEGDWWDGKSADLDHESEGEDEGENDVSATRLQSIHSLVLYHHVTLDRITRACLLSPHAGYQVTYKLLMSLFGLVLDLGKAVKEVERRMLALDEAERRVRSIADEWEEKEAVFLYALERLSLRTSGKAQKPATDGAQDLDAEHDLQLLFGGESENHEGQPSFAKQRGAHDLQDLLLRLRLGSGTSRRGGRFRAEVV